MITATWFMSGVAVGVMIMAIFAASAYTKGFDDGRGFRDE